MSAGTPSRATRLEVSLSLSYEAPPGAVAASWLPDEAFVERWARRAVDAALEPGAAPDALPAGDGALALELSVHLADARTSRALNRAHRGRDRATNVLSFPSGLPPLELPGGPDGRPATLVVLGDLVPCPEVIRAEAAEQGKDERAHWAHLVVHGTLHLLGLDHEDERSAASMEAVEIRLLSAAGLPDPYGAPPDETRP